MLQKVSDQKAGNTTTYAYDQLDRLSTAATTGASPASYGYALGVASKTGASATYYARTNSGEPISERTGTGRSYYLSDERGSITGLTDSTGALTATYKYDPYGRTLGTAAATSPTPADSRPRRSHPLRRPLLRSHHGTLHPTRPDWPS